MDSDFRVLVTFARGDGAQNTRWFTTFREAEEFARGWMGRHPSIPSRATDPECAHVSIRMPHPHSDCDCAVAIWRGWSGDWYRAFYGGWHGAHYERETALPR